MIDIQISISSQDTFIKLLETVKSIEIASHYFPPGHVRIFLNISSQASQTTTLLKECMRNYITNNLEKFTILNNEIELELGNQQLDVHSKQDQDSRQDDFILYLKAGTVILKDSLKEMFMHARIFPTRDLIQGEILIDPRVMEITNVQTETQDYIYEWNQIEKLELEEEEEYLENDLSFWKFIGCCCFHLYKWMKNLYCYIQFIPFKNPLYAAQAFEYKIKHIFSKCFESAIRVNKTGLQGGGREKKRGGDEGDNFIFMKKNSRTNWMHYEFLPSALAVHGPQKTIADLVLHRKNILTRTWMHSLNTIFKRNKENKNKEENKRNIFLILHHISILLGSIFSIPFFGIVLKFFTNIYVYYIYLFLLILTAVLALFKDPRTILKPLQVYTVLFGILAYTIYIYVILLIVFTYEINSISVLFYSFVGVFLCIQFIFGSTLYILLTLPSFLFYFPTYVHMFTFFSVLNTTDQDKKRAMWLFVNAVIYFVCTQFADYTLNLLLYIYIGIVSYHILGIVFFKIQQFSNWIKTIRYLCTHSHPLLL